MKYDLLQITLKMDNSTPEDENYDDDSQDFLINFPPEVQKAIEQVI